MDIVSFDDHSIPSDLEASANDLMVEAYGPDDDGGKATPQEACRAFMALDQEGRVISYLSAYVRRIDQNEASFEIGMIGDVATHTPFQRQGLAKRLVAAAHSYFNDRGLPFSILFAYDPPIYMSSNYRLMTDEMHFIDKDNQPKTALCRGSMICELSSKPWRAGLVNLNGRPV